jgi:hypothetical protein
VNDGGYPTDDRLSQDGRTGERENCAHAGRQSLQGAHLRAKVAIGTRIHGHLYDRAPTVVEGDDRAVVSTGRPLTERSDVHDPGARQS